MSSAKTLNLLAVAHNYKTQGKNVILMKVYQSFYYFLVNLSPFQSLTN